MQTKCWSIHGHFFGIRLNERSLYVCLSLALSSAEQHLRFHGPRSGAATQPCFSTLTPCQKSHFPLNLADNSYEKSRKSPMLIVISRGRALSTTACHGIVLSWIKSERTPRTVRSRIIVALYVVDNVEQAAEKKEPTTRLDVDAKLLKLLATFVDLCHDSLGSFFVSLFDHNVKKILSVHCCKASEMLSSGRV